MLCCAVLLMCCVVYIDAPEWSLDQAESKDTDTDTAVDQLVDVLKPLYM